VTQPAEASSLLGGYAPPERVQLLEPAAWQRLKLADAAIRKGLAPASMAIQRRVPPDGEDVGYRTTDGGIAVIRFHGYVSKTLSWWSWLFGSGASCEFAQESLWRAVGDSNVKGIALDIYTWGGGAPGVGDFADAIIEARAKKPVIGMISDAGCSAGYWIGSACSKLYVNSTGHVGSIGVVVDYEDWSRLEKNVGVEHDVITSTPLKGAGYDGPLTESQRSEWQRQVNTLSTLFVAAVARGRGITLAKAQALADARIEIGQDAVNAGFCDGVTTLSALIGQMETEVTAVPDGVSIVIEPPPHGPIDEDINARTESQRSLPEGANRKEPEMKPSKENLAALGLPESATEDEFNKRLAEKLAAPKQSEPKTDAPASAVTAEQFAELSARLDRQAADFNKMLETELSKRMEAQAKTQRVEASVIGGIKAGKVTTAQKEPALQLAAANPEAFDAFLAKAPRVAPTVSVFDEGKEALESGNERELKPGAFSDVDPRDAEACARLDAAAEKYAAQKGISVTDAIDALVGVAH